MDNNNAPKTYVEAIAELEGIITSLQDPDCDIDTMVAKTRRGAFLLKFCRSRLTTVSQELDTILDDNRETPEQD